MTREEEIKEAIKEDNSINTSEAIRGFTYGSFWADNNPHWIDVEEDLPPFETDVLCLYGSRGKIEKFIRIDSRKEGNPRGVDRYGFVMRDAVINGKFKTLRVKYWMGLPEIPKKYKDE